MLICPALTLFSTLPEEVTQQARTFVCQAATFHNWPVIVGRIFQQVESSTSSTRLGISGAKHNTLQSRVDHCAGTHWTGFQCDVQSTTHQAVISTHFTGIAHCDDFRMGARVVQTDVVVPATPDYYSFPDNYSTDRYEFNQRSNGGCGPGEFRYHHPAFQ